MKRFCFPIILPALALGVGLGLATRNVGVGIAVGVVFWLIWAAKTKAAK